MNKKGIRKLLKENPDLRDKLFERGFLFTNAEINTKHYPFFGIWKEYRIQNYLLIVSRKQNCYVFSNDFSSIILVGHAYNPFSMVYDETIIIESLYKEFSLESLNDSSSSFWKEINELTGVFTIVIIDGEFLYVIGDASGMQTTYYSAGLKDIYISSHTNIIGDLLDLEWDPYVKQLVRYSFFKLFGNALPGDLTQFKEIKRLIPNHYLKFANNGNVEERRFYWPCKLNLSENEIVDKAAALMHSNMELISRKWKKPAISLTGGCDSKTTLSCTNGLYDRFSYFSYISSDSEKVDAIAAGKICNALGLKHHIYSIPVSNRDVKKYDVVSEIINWNTGNIMYSHPNDVRKRIIFEESKDFDIEVKSWASEIGRAYYSKRFHGRKNFGDSPSGRKCTTLYKFFFHNRKLVKETDHVFQDYLKNYFEQDKTNPIEWQEQFFWEFRVPSWNGLVITGEHRYSFDITIPYNNRKLIELLLSAPIDTRINDVVYRDIRKNRNHLIDNTGIAVINLKHTNNRELVEGLYYLLHTHFEFM